MHLNYHYLKFLCPEIGRLINGMEVTECFSQNKNELVLGFSGNGRQQFIRSNLAPANTCISFPGEFKRSKKNNVSLFREIIQEKVSHVQVLDFERGFTIHFSSGQILLFKLHGTRSNILLYPEENAFPVGMFRHELKDDATITIQQLRNCIVPDWERFVQVEGNASLFLPTLGKIPREWLLDKGYFTVSTLAEKWKLMEILLDLLEHPVFSIVKLKGQFLFTLLPSEAGLFQTEDPVEAANEYFRYAVVFQSFEKEKSSHIKNMEKTKKRTQSYLKKASGKLSEIENAPPLNQLADIIMASLYQIPQGAEKVVLFDFYHNQEIEVELKKGISPQKLAENLYRKSKNRKIEIKQLKSSLQEKSLHLKLIDSKLGDLRKIEGFKELRAFAKDNPFISQKKDTLETVPYKRFEIEGFDLLVGKSAKANDELLRHYSWKEDLWFHARNVSGSHAVLKYKSGREFPATTIEKAAELAAYYSKNKNESIAAVIYTPCKYVRKVKGSAPGAVKVEKETVIMVSPKGPKQSIK